MDNDIQCIKNDMERDKNGRVGRIKRDRRTIQKSMGGALGRHGADQVQMIHRTGQRGVQYMPKAGQTFFTGVKQHGHHAVAVDDRAVKVKNSNALQGKTSDFR